MPPESRKLLLDMLDAATAVAAFARGRSLADMATDDLFRSAIYWKFVIIGEALSQLRKHDAALAGSITEARRIVGFRNQAIHGYGVLQDNVTWQIIEEKLPVLIAELQRMLQSP